jgi:hypothetical protein
MSSITDTGSSMEREEINYLQQEAKRRHQPQHRDSAGGRHLPHRSPQAAGLGRETAAKVADADFMESFQEPSEMTIYIGQTSCDRTIVQADHET